MIFFPSLTKRKRESERSKTNGMKAKEKRAKDIPFSTLAILSPGSNIKSKKRKVVAKEIKLEMEYLAFDLSLEEVCLFQL